MCWMRFVTCWAPLACPLILSICSFSFWNGIVRVCVFSVFVMDFEFDCGWEFFFVGVLFVWFAHREFPSQMKAMC